jgi:FkbM family methyltransferase
MNALVRRILTSTRLSRRLYFAVRQTYQIRRIARAARREFINADKIRSALHAPAGSGGTALIDLRTVDGLTITMRQNYADAMTVADVFLDNPYVRGLNLPREPVIVDVGGFIGDFSVYAAKRLNARRVIVCEPSPRNWQLLRKNISNNHYDDRIVAVNKAVTDGSDAMMNIDAPDEEQCMVSAYSQGEGALTQVSGISLPELLRQHQVDQVDLLKLDCEGAEFAILESTPSEVFGRIRNVVFEYHQVADLWTKLESVKERLHREGYVLQTRGGLISATRPVRPSEDS